MDGATSRDCVQANHPDCMHPDCRCTCHDVPSVDYDDWGWPLHDE